MAKEKIFYGWWVVAATFIMLVVGLGAAFYTTPVFLNPLQETFGWTRTQISTGFSIAAILTGILSPVVGFIIPKIGIKKVLLYGTTVVGICLVALGSMAQLWQYYVIMTVASTGITSIALIPSQTIVHHWFDKKRGLAMGIVMTGIGLGGMIMVIVATQSMAVFGWRWTYRIMGLACLGIVLPILLFLIKNKPEDIGLKPDGLMTTGDSEQKQAELGLTVAEAVKGLPFYIFAIMIVCFSIILGGFTQHAVAMMKSANIAQAGTFWGLVLGVSTAARLVSGYIADRFSQKTLMVLSWIFITLAMASIYYIPQNNALIWSFVIFFGLNLGMFAVICPLLMGRHFGVKYFSKFAGLYGLIQILAVAGGAVLLGRLFDLSGSYNSSLQLFILLAFLGLLASFFLIPFLTIRKEAQVMSAES